MKELILKRIIFRQRLSLRIFFTCIISMWAGLLVLLYYQFNDNITYLNFTLILIFFVCVLFTIMGIYMSKFFKAYITTVNKLSDKEASIFVQQGISRPFAEQWLPSFIIFQHKVKFFKLLKQPEYKFAEIKSIQFKRFNFTKSRQDCRITIELLDGRKHHYNVNGNLNQRNYLKTEAMACNTGIKIDDRYA